MPAKKSNEQFLSELRKKNPTIIPLEPYTNSSSRIRCKCTVCGKEITPFAGNLLKGEGCKHCAGNQKLTHAAFVDQVKRMNPNVTITGQYVNNKTRVEIFCHICGKPSAALPKLLLNGTGCRFCGHKKTAKAKTLSTDAFIKKLAQSRPDIEMLSAYLGMKEPASFKCKKCGTLFPPSVTPNSIMHGRQCDYCRAAKPKKKRILHFKAGRNPLMKTHETFVKEVREINPDIIVLEKYQGAAKQYQFKCDVCGHEWPAYPSQILHGKHGCPKCNKRWSTSFPEQALFFYLKRAFPDAINTYREGFGRTELDIYLPSIKTGIEYDGRNWHKNKFESERKKYQLCQKKGIRLVRVRERKKDSDVGTICDHCIVSNYGDTEQTSSLDESIIELLEYLSVNHAKIDTNRDRIKIQEQYFTVLKEKSLGHTFPEIAREWYQPKNGKITPYMVLPKSNDSYYWECPKCGHPYPAVVSNRTQQGSGCPRCAKQYRMTEEEFLKELNNQQPTIQAIGHYIDKEKKIDFKCLECEYVWSASPRNVLKRGCKKCNREASNRQKALSERDFYRRAQNRFSSIQFTGTYYNSESIIQCTCKKCGNTWPCEAGTILSGNTGCAACANVKPKKILCVETATMYPSISQASKETGISHVLISRCINGKTKAGKEKTAGGYHWRLAE